jgi:hypothetical protein
VRACCVCILRARCTALLCPLLALSHAHMRLFLSHVCALPAPNARPRLPVSRITKKNVFAVAGFAEEEEHVVVAREEQEKLDAAKAAKKAAKSSRKSDLRSLAFGPGGSTGRNPKKGTKIVVPSSSPPGDASPPSSTPVPAASSGSTVRARAPSAPPVSSCFDDRLVGKFSSCDCLLQTAATAAAAPTPVISAPPSVPNAKVTTTAVPAVASALPLAARLPPGLASAGPVVAPPSTAVPVVGTTPSLAQYLQLQAENLLLQRQVMELQQRLQAMDSTCLALHNMACSCSFHRMLLHSHVPNTTHCALYRFIARSFGEDGNGDARCPPGVREHGTEAAAPSCCCCRLIVSIVGVGARCDLNRHTILSIGLGSNNATHGQQGGRWQVGLAWTSRA